MNVNVCPLFENLITFDLYLRSAEDNTPLEMIGDMESNFSVGFDRLSNTWTKSLEEATNQNIDDFYKQFQKSGACITSPVSIWK